MYLATERQAEQYLESERFAASAPEELARKLLEAVDATRAAGAQVAMAGVDGAPDWSAAEVSLWRLGDALEGVLKRKKKEDLSPVFRALAHICSDSTLGKGRQPSARMLAQLAGGSHLELCRRLLSEDETIAGSVVKGLRLAKTPGMGEEVRELRERARLGWVRTEAKKYLERFA